MPKLLFTFILSVSCYFFFAQPADFIAAQRAANAYVAAQNIHYKSERNIYTDQNKVIHIFLYEDGNLLLGGFPTTATEKDKFQVHLYVTPGNRDKYLLEYAGTYSPALNIENENTKRVVGTEPVPLHFAVLGPFTTSLQLTLKRKPVSETSYNTLVSTTIAIAKTIHVSIGSGLIYSSLKNPGNIKTLALADGDTTLVADDVNGRGMLTLMATFYPGGRPNLMIPSRKFRDHFGVVVGTAIASGSSNFRDLFLGGQYDFAAGGSVVAGAHYGRRQKVVDVDYKDFSFGETKFSGVLDEKKYMDWGLGVFVGVQVDSRIFAQLFK